MQGPLLLIKKQLAAGAYPSAYLFSGANETEKNAALEYLLSYFLGENYRLNPDFFFLDSDPIAIADIRILREKCYRTPTVGKKNVFLIKNAENLSREAFGALLKVLEEPSLNSLIMVTTKNLSALPLTVRSRLAHFKFTDREKIQSASTIEKIKKMAPKARFDYAGELAKAGKIPDFVSEALFHFEAQAKEKPATGNIFNFERALLAQNALISDPTINKRLIGEYLMMLI